MDTSLGHAWLLLGSMNPQHSVMSTLPDRGDSRFWTVISQSPYLKREWNLPDNHQSSIKDCGPLLFPYQTLKNLPLHSVLQCKLLHATHNLSSHWLRAHIIILEISTTYRLDLHWQNMTFKSNVKLCSMQQCVCRYFLQNKVQQNNF